MVTSPGLVTMVEHHALLYRDLDDPLRLLRNDSHAPAQDSSGKATNLASYWPYAEGNTGASRDAVSDYTGLMAATQPAIAQEILDAYDFKPHRRLMDVGGGNGTFLLNAARRAPHLELVLSTCRRSRTSQQPSSRLVSRTERRLRGDFLKDLPESSNMISLIACSRP